MSERRRIAVATFGRSDFSILRPLCRLLVSDGEFDLGLWVGGAHFEHTSGRTIDQVRSSGLPIWAEIDPGEYERSALGTARLMAEQLSGFARAAAEPSSGSPDLVLILGDRFEAVAAGLALVPLGVPVGHISGGSITEGAIDDVFRHCLTKIAALHFCDLAQFARRIQHMGEPPERIFTTGALGLDAFRTTELHAFDEFVTAFDLIGLQPGYVLATLHPESQRPETTVPMTDAMIEALRETGRQVVYTYPNADPGSDSIIALIEAAVDGQNSFCVRGFGADWFPTAMRHAALIVGNSSGGIIEAASFGLSVVDIGDRQKGRAHGPNVIHSGRDRSAILDAIDLASSPATISAANEGNIYGDGRGSERVLMALKAQKWDELNLPKRFAEPDPTFEGARMSLR